MKKRLLRYFLLLVYALLSQTFYCYNPLTNVKPFATTVLNKIGGFTYTAFNYVAENYSANFVAFLVNYPKLTASIGYTLTTYVFATKLHKVFFPIDDFTYEEKCNNLHETYGFMPPLWTTLFFFHSCIVLFTKTSPVIVICDHLGKSLMKQLMKQEHIEQKTPISITILLLAAERLAGTYASTVFFMTLNAKDSPIMAIRDSMREKLESIKNFSLFLRYISSVKDDMKKNGNTGLLQGIQKICDPSSFEEFKQAQKNNNNHPEETMKNLCNRFIELKNRLPHYCLVKKFLDDLGDKSQDNKNNNYSEQSNQIEQKLQQAFLKSFTLLTESPNNFHENILSFERDAALLLNTLPKKSYPKTKKGIFELLDLSIANNRKQIRYTWEKIVKKILSNNEILNRVKEYINNDSVFEKYFQKLINAINNERNKKKSMIEKFLACFSLVKLNTKHFIKKFDDFTTNEEIDAFSKTIKLNKPSRSETEYIQVVLDEKNENRIESIILIPPFFTDIFQFYLKFSALEYPHFQNNFAKIFIGYIVYKGSQFFTKKINLDIPQKNKSNEINLVNQNNQPLSNAIDLGIPQKNNSNEINLVNQNNQPLSIEGEEQKKINLDIATTEKNSEDPFGTTTNKKILTFEELRTYIETFNTFNKRGGLCEYTLNFFAKGLNGAYVFLPTLFFLTIAEKNIYYLGTDICFCYFNTILSFDTILKTKSEISKLFVPTIIFPFIYFSYLRGTANSFDFGFRDAWGMLLISFLKDCYPHFITLIKNNAAKIKFWLPNIKKAKSNQAIVEVQNNKEAESNQIIAASQPSTEIQKNNVNNENKEAGINPAIAASQKMDFRFKGLSPYLFLFFEHCLCNSLLVTIPLSFSSTFIASNIVSNGSTFLEKIKDEDGKIYLFNCKKRFESGKAGFLTVFKVIKTKGGGLLDGCKNMIINRIPSLSKIPFNFLKTNLFTCSRRKK